MTTEHLVAALAASAQRHMDIYAEAGITSGWSHKTCDGITWVFDSCNDLGIPYFHKPGRKTLFVVSEAEDKLRAQANSPQAKYMMRTLEWRWL